jgi:hypothetical protein
LANSLGGNIFHGETHIKNTGGSPLYLGQNAPDIFNGDLYVTHSGGNGIYLAHWNSGGHQFNGHVFFTTTQGSTGGIITGEGGGSVTLAEGKTLSLNGVTSGVVRLSGFTQKGLAPFSLSLPSSGSGALTLGARSLFEGELSVTAPHLYLNGATFNQRTSFTKTVSGNNTSTGGNTYKGKVLIQNTAPSGTLNLSSQYQDMIQY